MTDIIPSGKSGSDRFDDKSTDPTKVLTRLDARILGDSLQNLAETTRGYNKSGNEGAGINNVLSDINLSNTSSTRDYKDNLTKSIQTLISARNLLAVNGSSTANAITLETRKITSGNSPDGTDYSKVAPLPFKWEEYLTFSFIPIHTNTGATQIQITDFTNASTLLDVVKEDGSSLQGGEIIQGQITEIYTKTFSGIKKYVLKIKNIIPRQITISNNVSDANNDIDFSAGNFIFSDYSGQASLSALTKRLDASWSAGTNQGGLFTGSKANSTWYHCFAIYNPTSGVVDCGFDTSITAANIPSGYTKYKRIGSIRTNGSGNIIKFFQIGKKFIWDILIEDLSAVANTSSASLRTITTPLGVKVYALIYVYFEEGNGSGSNYGLVTDPDQTDSTPTGATDGSGLNNLYGFNNGSFRYPSAYEMEVCTNQSSQIRTRSSKSTGNISVKTLGWVDYQL